MAGCPLTILMAKRWRASFEGGFQEEPYMLINQLIRRRVLCLESKN
jgi:hypothetical protein